MSAAIFFAGLLFLAVLPFVPALREVRLHRDATPLEVTRRSRVDVRHFARGFRSFVETNLGNLLHRARMDKLILETEFLEGRSAVVLPPESLHAVADVEERLVAGAGDLILEGGGMLGREVYARADLDVRASMTLRAALCEHDADLGSGARVLRWIHAGRQLRVGKGCTLFGRASADDALFLSEGVTFERLFAPTILVGHEVPFETASPGAEESLDPQKLGRSVEFVGRRALVRGNAHIPDGVLVDYDVVAIGELRVGAEAQVRGNLKSHERMWIGERAWLEGTAVSQADIHIAAGANVHGPVLSEETLVLERDARIGEPDRASTARARFVEVAPRARVHGTLWASEAGKVVSP